MVASFNNRIVAIFVTICLVIWSSRVSSHQPTESILSTWLTSSSSSSYGSLDMMREVFGSSLEDRMCPVDDDEDEETVAGGDDHSDTKVTCINHRDGTTVGGVHSHKIVSCQEMRLGGGSKNLTFSCNCKYLKSGHTHDCDLRPEYEPVHDNCLFVYVGMAVRFKPYLLNTQN